MLLLVLSAVVPKPSSWSDDNAQAFSSATAEVAKYKDPHHNPDALTEGFVPEDPAAMQAAEERHLALSKKLAHARRGNVWLKTLLRWAGIASLAAGIGGYLVGRSAEGG